VFELCGATKVDGRKTAGVHTRRCVLEATANALAAGGVRAVSVRAVCAEAGANGSAVKYHFGSREALIAEVQSDATRQVQADQDARLSALEAPPEPRSVRGRVAAWALPLIGVLSSTAPRDRRLARIVSHVLHDDPGLADQFREMASATDARLIKGLRRTLGFVDERELWLRLTVIVSALAGLARVDALGGAQLDRAVEVPEAVRADLERRHVVLEMAVVDRDPREAQAEAGDEARVVGGEELLQEPLEDVRVALGPEHGELRLAVGRQFRCIIGHADLAKLAVAVERDITRPHHHERSPRSAHLDRPGRYARYRTACSTSS